MNDDQPQNEQARRASALASPNLKCRACEYPIAGQPPPSCPECGIDFSANPPGSASARVPHVRNLVISAAAVPISMLVYYAAVGLGLGFDFPLSPGSTHYALWRGLIAGAVLTLVLTAILGVAGRLKFVWALVTLVMTEAAILVAVYLWVAMTANV